MAYSIHSTEVGGTLASLRLLHHLASSDDEAVRAMLDGTVLLVLPSHNPDGTDLVAEWYRRQLGTPFEGTSPPVLYHPYAGHDNNRDWYMFTQPETRLTLLHLYHRWHPQIVHDVHQMGPRGARLFVPPYADPWEPNVDGALVAAAGALGSHVASRLTTAGHAGVVTGAIFDAWTPGRAYPHTHGGVRLLSETASARLATPVEVKPEERERRGSGYDPRTASANFPAPWPGGTWRLGDVVEMQLQASLAILEHAAAHREHWLRTALAVNRRACARRSPFAFVVPSGQRDPSAVARLVEVLRLGEVEVQRARAPFEAAGRRYEAGALVVPMQQPASGFAKTLLERQRYPDLREYEGGPPKRPYDVTAHTLPLLLGVEVDAVDSAFVADLEPVEVPGVPPGRVEGDAPRLALGHASGDLVALGRLLEQGVKVRWALEPFADAERSFAAGTLLVPASARRLVEPLASELGFAARAVRAEPRALRLRRPRVGLYRSWVPSMDEGWTRFVFEKEMGVAYQELHDREVRAGRLRERFDAIVLPDQAPVSLLNGHAPGSMPEEYTGGLGSEGVTALRAFVEAGGTLVALDSATGFAIDQLQLPVRNALAGVEPTVFFCPGSILAARADAVHPLAHGLPETTPVWFEGSPAFEVDERLGRPALRGRGPAPLRLAPRGRASAGQGRPGGGAARQGARRALRLPAAVPRAEPRDLRGPPERALPLRRRALRRGPSVLGEHGAEAVDREGLHRAAGARHRRGAQERVQDGLFGRLEGGLEEGREAVRRQERPLAGRLLAVAHPQRLRRREGDRVVAAAVAEGRARAREAEERPGGEPLEVAGRERRVGRHHDHAGAVGAVAGALQRPPSRHREQKA